MQRILRRTWISIIWQQMLRHCYESASWYLVFWHSNSLSPRLTLLPNEIGKFAGLDLWSQDAWQIPRISRCTWKWFNYALFHCFDFKMFTCPQAASAPQMFNGYMIRSTLLCHAQYPTYAIYREIGQPGICYGGYQLTSAYIRHYY